jgi:hypothetical protein
MIATLGTCITDTLFTVLNEYLPRFPAVLVYFLVLGAYHFSVANAQAVDPDKVDFTTISIYKDLRQCLKDRLYYNPGNVQCNTNTCMCRPSTQGQAVQIIAKDTLQNCQNLDDVSTATSIVTAYCSSKGYSLILSATILQTGASTVTVIQTAYYGAGSSGPLATTTVFVAEAPRHAVPSRDYIHLGRMVTTALVTILPLIAC